MSTQSSFVTSATELRAYAPAADPSLASPASRAAGAHARPLASRRDLRTEPGPIRFIIIALAVTFLSVFVVLPLVVVFAQAFSKGISAYFTALAEPEALSAIRLTLLVAAVSVGLNLVFGVAAAWAIQTLVPMLPADVPRVENIGPSMQARVCSGIVLKQDHSAFKAASISGSYGFSLIGGAFSPSLPSLQVQAGTFSSDGAGNLSGEFDMNGWGGAVNFTFSSNDFAVSPFGRGTATLNEPGGGTVQMIFYIVNGSRVRMMEAGTPGTVGLTIGDAVTQTSVPANNTNFNGNFAYLLSGVGSRSLLTRIGRFTADGNGGLGSIFADTNDGGTTAQVPNGSLSATTYAIDTNFPGSGRGMLTFTDSKLGTFSYVVYLSSSSGGVIQDVSKNTVADGNIQLQIGSPFSNSSLAGDYGMNFSGLGNNNSNGIAGEEDYVGQIALTNAASNNVSGAVDFSAFSSNQGVFFNVVVSGNGLIVGGDGTTSTGTRNTLSLKLAGNPSTTLNFAAYIVNSQTIYVAGTDSARVITGTVNLQAP